MTPLPANQLNGKTPVVPAPRPGGGSFDLLRWKLTARPARWPSHVALVPQSPPAAPRGREIVATWVGHSTFLLQTSCGNFLTDPVWAERASPVQWAGPRRVHAPGLAFDSLPRIDCVLLSHDHYDHCDLTTLRRLAKTHDPLFVAPLRHRDLLTAAGARQTAELDWWQSHSIAPACRATLTPACHWSNRLGSPRNHRLWGGFFLTVGAATGPAACDAPRNIWFAGDTGYDADLFREVGRRLGRPDLALLPIGAYEPRWFMAAMHLNPAEAVQAHLDTGAHRSVGMHWGTFQLTDEGRDDPVRDLAAARESAGLAENQFGVLAPGASLTV